MVKFPYEVALSSKCLQRCLQLWPPHVQVVILPWNKHTPERSDKLDGIRQCIETDQHIRHIQGQGCWLSQLKQFLVTWTKVWLRHEQFIWMHGTIKNVAPAYIARYNSTSLFYSQSSYMRLQYIYDVCFRLHAKQLQTCSSCYSLLTPCSARN